MYYNQNKYANVPYPAPGYPDATVKSGGCGVCCASMIVEGLTGQAFPPETSAAYAIKAGARVPGGTDMRLLGTCLSRDFELICRKSDRAEELLAHLGSGGWAVANVGGDREGYTGLFSDAGHYVVARGTASDGRVCVWDPGKYEGKYSKPGRKGKVTVSGDDCLVDVSYLDADCANRSPRYYLFGKEKNMQEVTVKIGNTEVPAKLIGEVTYAELRPLIEAIKNELTVTWTPEEGAGVKL